MTPYTPEEIALARRIAAQTLCNGENWKPGVKAGMYADITAGMADNEPLVQIALAAIRATTERAAKEADTWPGIGCEIADALRANHHLKDRPDAG